MPGSDLVSIFCNNSGVSLTITSGTAQPRNGYSSMDCGGTTGYNPSYIDCYGTPDSCAVSLQSTADSGYFFAGWTTGGTLSVVSGGEVLDADLGLALAGNHDGDISLLVGPQETLTVNTFVNWSTPWSYGEAEVCGVSYGACAARATSGPYGGGSNATPNQMYVALGYDYTLTAIDMTQASFWYFDSWSSSAGSLSSQTSDPTTLDVSGTGQISMYTRYEPTPMNMWAGWVASPASSNSEYYSVSGTMLVPNATANGIFGVWIGFGGGPGASPGFFQAGIVVNGTSGGSSGFYAEQGGGGCTCTVYQKLQLHALDSVEVTLTSYGGSSNVWINDTTDHAGVSSTGQSMTACDQSVEWIAENQGSGSFTFTSFRSLYAGGGAMQVQGSFYRAHAGFGQESELFPDGSTAGFDISP